MRYIPRVDEILVPPAYMLGTSKQHQFQSNLFVVPASTEKLQELVDEQLNAALPDGPVRYRVPDAVQRVYIGFFRYQRSQSETEPSKGWLAYSEMMIGVLCLREFDDHRMPAEWVTYLGVVYIDSYNYSGTPKDPCAIPIVLGRESYGLPKNPARILYEPRLGQPQLPRLDLWDPDVETGELVPKTALRIYPKPVTPFVAGAKAGIARHPFPKRQDLVKTTLGEVHDFHPISMGLGIDPASLDVRGTDHHPQASAIGVPGEDKTAIGWKGLLWGTKLVGLKQFVDPQSKADVPRGGLGDACYQSIVESPIEEIDCHKLHGPTFLPEKQVIEFPKVERVDLIEAFGLEGAENRKIVIGQDSMFYQHGQLCFATPNKVSVWNPQMGYPAPDQLTEPR